MNSCGQCVFYYEERFKKITKCRRYPPVIISPDSPDDYPNTDSNNWCGEFKHVGVLEYEIVNALTTIGPFGLNELVANKISEGWDLFGSPCSSDKGFFQAMVRDKYE